MRNTYIAAAVAAALSIGAVGTAAASAGPSAATASAAAHKVFIAGSSAAAGAVIDFIQKQYCTGGAVNSSVFTTPTTAVNAPDFRAISCNSTTFGGLVTVYYRAEGGSVVGVLPVINTIAIKQLAMTDASCVQNTTAATSGPSVFSCTGVTGSAPTNGTADTWGGTVQTVQTDIGVSDLEPGVFGTTAKNAGGGLQNPVNSASNPKGPYNVSFTGAAHTAAQLQAMTHGTVFQQVFGFVVSNNLTFSDLPKDQIAAIFDGNVTDWDQVTLANNTAAGSGAIVVCHREVGSGTRAATDLFLNNQGCGASPGSVSDTDTGLNNLQTSAELDCVNGAGGNAIGYVSVDNFSKTGAGNAFPNTKSITVSGGIGDKIHAGSGGYGFVYEASIQKSTLASTDGTTLYNSALTNLRSVNTTSNSAQVLAIPGQPAANHGRTPLQAGTGGALTSDFIRAGGAGNSCTPLTNSHD